MRYFYKVSTPYKPSYGDSIYTYNDEDFPIASLEEARELALEHRVISMKTDRVDTTYGVEYDLED